MPLVGDTATLSLALYTEAWTIAQSLNERPRSSHPGNGRNPHQAVSRAGRRTGAPSGPASAHPAQPGLRLFDRCSGDSLVVAARHPSQVDLSTRLVAPMKTRSSSLSDE